MKNQSFDVLKNILSEISKKIIKSVTLKFKFDQLRNSLSLVSRPKTWAILCGWNHNFGSSRTILVSKNEFCVAFSSVFFNSTFRTLTSRVRPFLVVHENLERILQGMCIDMPRALVQCASDLKIAYVCKSLVGPHQCNSGSGRTTEMEKEWREQYKRKKNARCGYLTPGRIFLGCAKN